LAVVGGLGSLPLVFGEATPVSIVTAADSCVYQGSSATPADRRNAWAIIEGDADAMFVLGLRDGHRVHTYSRYFGPKVDATHCATGVNYSLDGGTSGVTFVVDLTLGKIVDVN
jgi:hypothetical protein